MIDEALSSDAKHLRKFDWKIQNCIKQPQNQPKTIVAMKMFTEPKGR